VVIDRTKGLISDVIHSLYLFIHFQPSLTHPSLPPSLPPPLKVKSKSDVRLLTPPGGSAALPPGVATVGWEGEAVWVGDGQWYAAQVLGLVEHGYKVAFTKYAGNEVEVPLEFLRERSSVGVYGGGGGGGGGREGGMKRGKEEKEVKEFVIPDALRLLPTDREEEKARKRRKVKHLKGLWKQRTQGGEGGGEDEVEETKNWQAYLKKSKKPKLGMGALKKGSIFKSPDAVDGKVGVMGSGSGMTNFAKRAFKPGKGEGPGGGSKR